MPLPCPGPAPISLLDIQNEFGGTYLDGTFTQIREYYRGGSYVQNTPTNANIPTSGQISFDQFFCSLAEIVVYITQNTANVDVRSLFGSNWTSLVPKRLVINPGVIVYNTNPYAISNLNGYAMRIYDDFNGRLTIQNFGSIQGAGGRGGGTPILSGESRTNLNSGGQGGNAIYIGPTSYGGGASSPRRTVFFDNRGTIYAGGGGGGASSGSGGTKNYSFQNNNVRIELTTLNQTYGGGLGQGYNQTKTNSTVSGAGGSYRIVFSTNGWATSEMRFPPNSDITVTAQSAYTRNIYIGSNSIGRFSHTASGIGNIGSDGCIYLYPNQRTSFCGFNFSGNGLGGMYIAGNNSTVNVSFGSGSSGCYQLTKDPNQVVNGSLNPSSNNTFGGFYAVINQSGGGPEQTQGFVRLSGNWGTVAENMPQGTTPSSPAGAGGDWGQNGGSGGSGSGGASGYSIVNASQYVSYISQGSIAGPTT